jgi:hypothetical protein
LYFVTQSHVTVVELKTFLKTKEESEVLHLKCGDDLIHMEVGGSRAIAGREGGWNNVAAYGQQSGHPNKYFKPFF